MPLFIDAHCHPALKRYLYDYSVFRNSFGRKDNNYFNIQVTVPALKVSGLNGVISAHHLPEKNIITDWNIVNISRVLLHLFFNNYFQKVEKDDAYSQTLEMIDKFEADFPGHDDAVIAHNVAEMEAAIEGGKIFFLHAIEGAHHLGRGLPVSEYERRIDELKSKGLALITLAHFYPNDIAHPVEGIQPGTKRLLGMQFTPDDNKPLTPDARRIVSKILDAGIIVDLTHTNPLSRKEIFEINDQRGSGKRPIVFSHVGVRALFTDEDNPSFALMSPDDEEIIAIKNCNGVIGVVFMNYWLTGKEEKFLSGRDNGFENIFNTIKHIATVTGSFDHIAIGTDFDGWAESPDDFFDASMLGSFRERLMDNRQELNASAEDIEKVTGKNIWRVLNEGWT